MGVQHVLNLRRVDIVAAGDDHPFQPLFEVDEALLVHDAQIAGVEPDLAVLVLLEGLGGLPGIVHIAQHDRGAGQADLAHGAVRHLVVGGGNDDFIIGVGEGDANGAGLEEKSRGQAAGGDAFGGAVALAHLLLGAVLPQEEIHLVFELRGQAVAAGEDALQLAHVQLLGILHAQKRLEQGGHAGNVVGLVLAQQFAVALGIKLGDQNGGAAPVEHRVNAHTETKAVKHRHDGQHGVARVQAVAGGAGLKRQRVEIQVAQQDSLAGAGGAAGVENGGHIAAGGVVDVSALPALSGGNEVLPEQNVGILGQTDLLLDGQRIEQLLHTGQTVGHIADQQGLEGEPIPDAGELRIELPERQAEHAVGVVDVVDDLLLAGQGVDHVGHCAHAVDGIEQDNGLGRIGHTDGHPVAGAHALGAQRLGGGMHLSDEILKAHFVAVEVIGRRVGQALGRGLHRVDHGTVEILQRSGNVARCFEPRRFHVGRHRPGDGAGLIFYIVGALEFFCFICSHSSCPPPGADPAVRDGHRCVG